MKDRKLARIALTATLSIVVLGTAWFAVLQPAPLPVNNPALFVVLALACLLGPYVRVFRTEHKGSGIDGTLDLFTMVPTAVLFSPMYAVILAAAGAILQSIRERVKVTVAFENIVVNIFAVASAFVLVDLMLPQDPGFFAIWLGLFIAMVPALMLTISIFWIVFETKPISVLIAGFRSATTLVFLASSASALIIVLARNLPVALFGLAAVIATGARVMKGLATSNRKVLHLELLLSLTDAMQRASSVDEVRHLITEGVKSELGCDHAAFEKSPTQSESHYVLFPVFPDRPYLVLGARNLPYFPDELQMLEGLATVAGAVVANLELREEIETQARHDTLTGVWNRRGFMEAATATLARAERAETMTAICYIDLDNFKPINDLFGHQLGDEFLAKIAEQIRSSVRGGDLVARFGGDEFVVLLTDVSEEQPAEDVAVQLIERISTPLNVSGHTLECSASVGVAIAPDDGDSLDELLEAADKALYEAKHSGRHTYRRAIAKSA